MANNEETVAAVDEAGSGQTKRMPKSKRRMVRQMPNLPARPTMVPTEGPAIPPLPAEDDTPGLASGSRAQVQEMPPPLPYTIMHNVTPRPSEWLWFNRIPFGELTVLDGNPGVNKSSLTLDIAARVSKGRDMPDGSKGITGCVLLLTAEDSISKTLTHRLNAAGADMTKIAVLTEPLTIPDGLDSLEEMILRLDARLVVIDPLMFYLGRNANDDQSVRKALTPLHDLAERRNVAVLLVRHLTKTGGKQSLYRGSGSIAIIGIARSALLLAPSPQDPNMKVLCHQKSNLGQLGPSLLLEPVSVGDSVAIRWHGECDYTADDLLEKPKGKGQAITNATQFLIALLAEGPVAEKDVEAKAVEAQVAWRTVERAKSELGVVSHRKGFGPKSTVYWQLPKDQPDLPEDQPDAPPSHTPPDEPWRGMSTKQNPIEHDLDGGQE